MPAVQSFTKSVILGGLAGAAPFLVFLVFIIAGSPYPGTSEDRVMLLVKMPALILAISTTVVLVASVIIGLPLTAVLKRRQWESADAYTVSGAVAGAALPVLPMLFTGEFGAFMLVICGAFGGAITGRTWWLSARRGAVADRPQ
ncbi:hypothetical protein EUV02_03085 [Polymorphobacter arshaanensis]|uniref:Uncharacterized protein n=1 Tax=Glacieibacterium arshaanense TaxID=2511025 RepID=A0A4Y9ES51_9SPHN|nr:hypothetical protein [Polymorphobacter arshaanensis]TFU06019.1 hypothetical protein EUV02_03085 [Polymorphobacter arshaanensis]